MYFLPVDTWHQSPAFQTSVVNECLRYQSGNDDCRLWCQTQLPEVQSWEHYQKLLQVVESVRALYWTRKTKHKHA